MSTEDTHEPEVIKTNEQLSGLLSNGQVVVDEITHGGGVVIQLDASTDLIGAEIGTMRSSWSSYMREEYNGKLRGIEGLRVYDRMRRSDSAVRSSLKTIKTPVLGATWFVQPGDEDELSKEIASFVEKNLFHGMTYNWRWVLREALNSLDYGYYMFEKVWAVGPFAGSRGPELRAFLKKLAPRHPLDVTDWNFDANGGPVSVNMYEAEPGMPDFRQIPIEKLAVFTYDGEAGDITGLSLLRSAYKHWYFKENAYRIDAIQKERHGIGVPVIILPMNADDKDIKKAINLARNIRVNENAYAVLPFGWELKYLKLEGDPVNVLATAEHHSKMVFQNVLAQAMWGSSFGVTNTDAVTSMDLFYKSVRQIAEEVADVINQYVIPQLVGFNWDVDNLPQLKVRSLGDVRESRELSFAIRNHVGAGLIRPDDRLEEWARETIDAPPADTKTTRVQAAPQLPKQSQAGNQQIMPKSNAGDDSSGG